jgi:hypothetical protein
VNAANDFVSPFESEKIFHMAKKTKIVVCLTESGLATIYDKSKKPKSWAAADTPLHFTVEGPLEEIPNEGREVSDFWKWQAKQVDCQFIED